MTFKPLSIGLLPLLLCASMANAEDRITEGSRTTINVPDIPAALLSRTKQFANIRAARSLSWHHSGEQLLISTRLGNTSQLHGLSAPLGMRQQITFFDEPISGGVFSPVDDRIMFGRDVGGDENFQGFLLNSKDGVTTQFTPSGSRNTSFVWSSSGEQIAFQSNQDNATRFDIWITSADAPENSRMLVQGTGFYWSPVEFSSDDQKLLVINSVSAIDRRLHVVDVSSGEMTRIGPDATVNWSGALFNQDDSGVYAVADLDSEYRQLQYIDLESGEITTLSAGINWDVSSIGISPNGRTLAFVTNEDGYSRVYLLNTRNNTFKPAKGIPDGVIYGLNFAADNRSLAMTINRANLPANVYVYDVRRDNTTQWTKGEIGGLDTDKFVEPTLTRYPAWDEVDSDPRQIPLFVYKPHSPTGKLPVVIRIHGGPAGQSRPTFSSRTQLLTEQLDAAILVPNVRGSTGYGKTFVELDNGVKREDSVRDIGSLLDWIATQPDLDPERVAVVGGSYGGYMVLASMTHYSDRLKAGINLFGLSNLVTFLENTADYRRDHRRNEYGDERIPEVRDYLLKTAPMNNAEEITKPLFVLQGLNDPRVPASESEQIVEKVRSAGTPVWYLLWDNEGHGFRKKPNQIYSEAAMAQFLKEHL
jgi:dipeptidyl aminopeptidase/acylaminoacyl peptidase